MHMTGFWQKSHAAILLHLALAICVTYQSLWHLKAQRFGHRFTESFSLRLRRISDFSARRLKHTR
jgi:hypothetical protein